ALAASPPKSVRPLAAPAPPLAVQPDASPTLWASPPQLPWTPELWQGSVLGMLGYDNITYNAPSMLTGNFFPALLGPDRLPSGTVFDGQSSVTRKARRSPRRGFIGGSELTFPGEFVALAPWAGDPGELRSRAEVAALRLRCESSVDAAFPSRRLGIEERRRILYDCA